ncbi:MAG: citrate/2-methylcitrate synthase [Desulfococcaceae bacterium]|jgi:citrate synthase|nr:citrate/2-methylcitrate synthase [Desulfococcaceae bacterium]
MTDECKVILNTGLRGITIASTKISDVRGNEGKLIYRGYLVKDLAENASFEEVTYLLLFEKMPGRKELEEFKKQLGEARAIPAELTDALKTRPRDALPMDILQAGVAMLAHHDPDVKTEGDREATLRMAIRLIAQMPTLLAAWERIRKGKEPLTPLPELDHAANFLYMMSGEKPDEELSGFFDACLVLHAEHSFNASTFAAREIASTRAHIYAAVAGAIGSLSGALHGGANTRVMKMLMKIGSIDAIDAYIRNELDTGGKIMGLGHAVYKVDDPRALILAPMAKKMGERVGETKWYDISEALEKKAKAAFKQHKNMDIFVNVDFYSASLYYSMGIDMDLFTPLFAISRIAGWVTHVLEEQFADAAPKPMLYRPESDYVGDYCGPDECTLDHIDKR